MTWRLFPFRLTTGLLGPELPDVGFSWSATIRDAGIDGPTNTGSQDITSLTFPQSALSGGVADTWLAPGKNGLVAMWDETPIVVTKVGPTDDSWFELAVSTEPITTLLAKRFVAAISGEIAKSTVEYRGLSLGTIAKRVAQYTSAKSGGGLPWIFPADETAADDADHQRTFPGYNLANQSVADLWTKLSNVEHGPDIGIRPVLVDDAHIGLKLLTGTETDPRIMQDEVATWEVGGDSVEDFQRRISDQLVAQRVYATGSGTDEGTIIAVAEDLASLEDGLPLVEKHISDSAWDSQELAQSHANAELAASFLAQQWTVTVRADGVNPLGTFWPGDLVQLHITGHPRIPEQTYESRVLEMSGSDDASVKLVLAATEWRPGL